ncbi:MAG: gamma-glutamyltransferase, partial [Pseudomonadota bacterium]
MVTACSSAKSIGSKCWGHGAWSIAVMLAVALGLGAFGATTGPLSAQDGRINPEAESGTTRKTLATAERFMVSAANPYAVRAGVDILRRGGSAVDAAIAVQLVLNLVEPQSSGIGGGAFLLHYDRQTNQVMSYDGRETAPALAEPDRFLDDDQRPLPFRTIVRSGLSVGVPGLVALLADVHTAHGVLPWADLFEPAISLAREGFEVSNRLHRSLLWVGADHFSPDARAYFFPNGSPAPVGSRLRNPAFAETLTRIAEAGGSAFYSGEIAQAIVEAVDGAKPTLADLKLNDLAKYRAKVRTPVCAVYRKHRICGMGPPSSGGITVAQTLRLLERFDLRSGPGDGAPRTTSRIVAMHLIAEAQKLA